MILESIQTFSWSETSKLGFVVLDTEKVTLQENVISKRNKKMIPSILYNKKMIPSILYNKKMLPSISLQENFP